MKHVDFVFDGKKFDHHRVDQVMSLGAVEEWTIKNLSDNEHPIHIHVNPIMVTKINGEPVAEPIWQDVAIVPRYGSITFRQRFLDFDGRFMLHCHILHHEDLGMMQALEVRR